MKTWNSHDSQHSNTMKHKYDSWKQNMSKQINVSVQIRCEDHNHERWTISSIFLETWKHENHQNLFNLQGICMSYTN